MRLSRPAALALVAGTCYGERLGALNARAETIQRIRNVSFTEQHGAASTHAKNRYSLLKTSHHPASTSPSSTSHAFHKNLTVSYPHPATVLSHFDSNGTCGQVPTINVPNASLDWWYASTVYDAISTFSIQFDSNDSVTGWTLLPAKTPFNLGSAIGMPSPVAAATTVITQIAHKTLNATSGVGQIPNVIITPPPASITVPNYAETIHEGTPFVYFSTYEIISRSPTWYNDGRVGCATVTKTSPMVTPFVFPYTGVANGSNSTATGWTGNLDSAFLRVVDEPSAVAGSWVAAPTVIIVVQEIFAAEAALAASIERTETSLEVPTPILPSFLSPVKPLTTEEHLPSGNANGQTETTETFLLVPTSVPTKSKGGGHRRSSKPTRAAQWGGGQTTMMPFVAHIEHTEVTLMVPVSPTQTVVTTKLHGEKVTATRIPQDRNLTKGTKAKPTNAVQVLSQAEESIKNSRPTISPNNHGGNSGRGSEKVVHVIAVGRTTFTANVKTIFHLPGSKTLTPGGTAVIAGTTLRLLPGGSSVVIDGHTEAVSSAVITPAPPLTINGHIFHANGGSTYIIGGKTLTPGGAISVGGTFVSLGRNHLTVVINGVTKDIASANTATATITALPNLTIGGEKFTPINHGATYDINGQPLTPSKHETVTIAGKTYIVSLAAGATILEIGTLDSKGVVTATMYETLYPGVGWKSISTTTTIGAAGASTVSKSGNERPHQTSRAVASLQNAASPSTTQLGMVAIVFAANVLWMWL